MKKILFIVLLLFTTIVYSKGKPKLLIHPTDNNTEDSFVFNAESNQYTNTTYINTSVIYSMTNGIDIGVMSTNIPVWQTGNTQAQNLQDDTFLILNKTFNTKYVDFILGTQSGYQLYTYSPAQPGSPGKLQKFYFTDNVFKINEIINVHFGFYYSNKALTTTTNFIGEMGGASVRFNDQYKLTVDTLSNQSNVSGTSANLHYFVIPKVDIYGGWFFPAHNSYNYNFLNFGINISTSALN